MEKNNIRNKDDEETVKLEINFRSRKAPTESLRPPLRNNVIYHLINPFFPALPLICYFNTLNLIFRYYRNMIKIHQHSSLTGTNYAIHPAKYFGARYVTQRGKKHCIHGICLTSGYTSPSSMQCLPWEVLHICPTVNCITNSSNVVHREKCFQWSSRVYAHHAQELRR